MLPSRRQKALTFLYTMKHDILVCKNVESACHAESMSPSEYDDRIRHAAFNLHENPNLDINVLYVSDEVLTENTLVGRIEMERRSRKERFEHMIQEKYDALNDREFQAIIRCRRCGSEDVSWEEKQTRSADEGATVFCSCQTCKNRWVIR